MPLAMQQSHKLLDVACGIAVAIFFLACAVNTPSAVAADNQNTMAIPAKTYVLILFLYDLNKNYHVLRAGTYITADSCNKSGKNVTSALNQGKLQNQNYLCLEADLPY